MRGLIVALLVIAAHQAKAGSYADPKLILLAGTMEQSEFMKDREIDPDQFIEEGDFDFSLSQPRACEGSHIYVERKSPIAYSGPALTAFCVSTLVELERLDYAALQQILAQKHPELVATDFKKEVCETPKSKSGAGPSEEEENCWMEDVMPEHFPQLKKSFISRVFDRAEKSDSKSLYFVDYIPDPFNGPLLADGGLWVWDEKTKKLIAKGQMFYGMKDGEWSYFENGEVVMKDIFEAGKLQKRNVIKKSAFVDKIIKETNSHLSKLFKKNMDTLFPEKKSSNQRSSAKKAK